MRKNCLPPPPKLSANQKRRLPVSLTYESRSKHRFVLNSFSPFIELTGYETSSVSEPPQSNDDAPRKILAGVLDTLIATLNTSTGPKSDALRRYLTKECVIYGAISCLPVFSLLIGLLVYSESGIPTHARQLSLEIESFNFINTSRHANP